MKITFHCGWEKNITNKTRKSLRPNLSRRQAEAIFCLVQENGISNEDIAKTLNCCIRTVEKHFEQIFIKLGVDNRTAAALKAREFLKNPIR